MNYNIKNTNKLIIIIQSMIDQSTKFFILRKYIKYIKDFIITNSSEKWKQVSGSLCNHKEACKYQIQLQNNYYINYTNILLKNHHLANQQKQQYIPPLQLNQKNTKMLDNSIIPSKSPNDKRQYQALILSNQLKILFIHDHEIVKSSCSISVGVGSLYDKESSLGLAHFLQHMLFMGSKKYPLHNQYAAFISANSGFDNAYTIDTQTNFYFQIKNSGFYQAVDRLTNFFTCALLSPFCIQKQIQSVHEQFVLWTNDDNCRKWQVLKKFGSALFSRFNLGNLDTLKHQHIRDDLVQFYQQYYSSNIINAVVYSNQKIQDMKNTLIPLFQTIPNKHIQKQKFPLHFTSQQTGKLILMQSIKSQSYLQFYFFVQYLKPLYKKHISQYITHILGHQGKNSLLSILKDKKYASELTAYKHDIDPQTIIGIEIKLTEDGEDSYEQLYNITMDFLSNLTANQTIFQQIKQRKQIQFLFKQKQKIISDYTSKLSSKMHDIPLPQLLNSTSLFDPFNQQLINRVLAQLNPFNLILILSSIDQLQNPTTEKYLGAKYQIHTLPERNKSGVNFQVLPKNQYIPVDTTLYLNKQQLPVLAPIQLHNNINFIHDNIFKVCKGGIQFRIASNQDSQFMQFYSNYLSELLTELTHQAQTIGTQIEYSSQNQLTLTLFGFSDTITKLLSDIADNLHELHHTEKSKILFQVTKDNLIQQYQNTYNQQSDIIAQKLLNIILTKNMKSIEQSTKQFQSYQYQETTERITTFWKNNQFKWLAVGNFEQQSIEQLIKTVENKMIGQNQNIVKTNNGCLKLTTNIIYQILLQSEQLSSSCATVYYQAGPYTQPLYYKLLLLKNYINEPFFNQLRTLKQIAYLLHVNIVKCKGVLGVNFIIVSSNKNPKSISDEIKLFVERYFGLLEQNLSGNNTDKFTTLKQSVFTKIQTPHSNLKSFFQFIIDELKQKKNYFTRKQPSQIRKHLNPIQVTDLIQFWNSIKNNTLELHIVSQVHAEEYSKYGIEKMDIEGIKNMFGFWDDFYQ